MLNYYGGLVIFFVAILSFNSSCNQEKKQLKTNDTQKEIVFVCTHGAYRSPVAAAHFNSQAKKKGLNYKAIFKGTEPSEELSLNAANGLKTDGYDIKDWKPSKVSSSDTDKAYKVITFGCTISDFNNPTKHIDWQGPELQTSAYDSLSLAIKTRVDAFISTLPQS